MREKYDSILSHFRPVYIPPTFRFPRRSPTNTVLTFLVSALELRILSAHSMFVQTTSCFLILQPAVLHFGTECCSSCCTWSIILLLTSNTVFLFGTVFYIVFCLAGTFKFITICRLSDGPRFVVNKPFSFVRKGR